MVKFYSLTLFHKILIVKINVILFSLSHLFINSFSIGTVLVAVVTTVKPSWSVYFSKGREATGK